MGDQQKNTQEPDVNQLRKVRREKLADLQANGKNPFEITKYDVTCHATDIKENFEEMEGKHVSVAGRVMQKRVMGKASFCNIADLKRKYPGHMLQRTAVGEEAYTDFKKSGYRRYHTVLRDMFSETKTDEISIHAAEITLLSKSHFRCSRRSSTDSPTQIQDTARDTLTS